jgi:LacI family transcriptional regulator
VPPPHNPKDLTIRDLAVMLGLSSATVSRALNSDPLVTHKTRKRVFDLAEKLGFRANAYAKQLRNGRSNTIGCIVPRLDNYIYSTIVSGIERTARLEEYSIVVMQSDHSHDQESDCAAWLFSKRIDGLLVVSAKDVYDLHHLQPFVRKNTPVVLFDSYANEPGFINLCVDNRAAGYDMTRHLLAQGARRIVHITSDTAMPAYLQRYEGYKMALDAAQVQPKEQYIIRCGLGPEDGIAAAEAIYRWKQKPDAIFVAGDHCAVACLTTLQKKGLRIPTDIAIAGFDNDPIGLAIDPQLTSMHYPARQAGETAVHQLMNQLHGSPAGKMVDTIVLRSDLVVRGSSQVIDY